MNLLSAENSLLLIIDIQEKLVNALSQKIIVQKASKLTKAATILGIPIVVTEQYPEGLGETILPIKQYLPTETKFIKKTCFNALLEEGMPELIKSYGKKQIVIAGIETHICVHQTATALIEEGYDVYVIKDACASRNKYEFKQGINIIQANGIKISCLEIALYEWLKSSKNPHFKEIQALTK